MDFSKIMQVLLAVAARIKIDFEDKKLTVNELLNLIKLTVDELGFGDVVILDLTKKEGKEGK